MEILQALILGIVQGLTEFFPISSSGHLIIIPKIFNWAGTLNSLSFDVSLHLGTGAALIIFFWKDWVRLISKFSSKLFLDRKNLFVDQDSKLFTLLIIGSIPAGLSGILFKDFIEHSLRSVPLIGVTLIIFALLLWYFDTKGEIKKDIRSLRINDAIIIGVAQALALIPGVSRSGVTITAARGLGIDRESSVRFSFLLSAPAILGAGIYTLKDVLSDGIENPQVFIIGFTAAFVSGILAIKFLIILAKSRNFNIFVIYRLVLGMLLIGYSFFV